MRQCGCDIADVLPGAVAAREENDSERPGSWILLEFHVAAARVPFHVNRDVVTGTVLECRYAGRARIAQRVSPGIRGACNFGREPLRTRVGADANRGATGELRTAHEKRRLRRGFAAAGHHSRKQARRGRRPNHGLSRASGGCKACDEARCGDSISNHKALLAGGRGNLTRSARHKPGPFCVKQGPNCDKSSVAATRPLLGGRRSDRCGSDARLLIVTRVWRSVRADVGRIA